MFDVSNKCIFLSNLYFVNFHCHLLHLNLNSGIKCFWIARKGVFGVWDLWIFSFKVVPVKRLVFTLIAWVRVIIVSSFSLCNASFHSFEEMRLTVTIALERNIYFFEPTWVLGSHITKILFWLSDQNFVCSWLAFSILLAHWLSIPNFLLNFFSSYPVVFKSAKSRNWGGKELNRKRKGISSWVSFLWISE